MVSCLHARLISLLSTVGTPFKDPSGSQPHDAASSPATRPQPGVAPSSSAACALSDDAPSSSATRPQPGVASSSSAACALSDDAPSSSATRPQPGVAPSSSAACALSDDAPSSSARHSQPDVTPLIPTLEKKPNTPEALPVELPEIVLLRDLSVNFPTPVKVPSVGESRDLDTPVDERIMTHALESLDEKG